jgi:O-antigen biosynthesis protein
VDYFCVTDTVNDGYGVFRLMPPAHREADSQRTARYIKTHLLAMFPEYDVVVWADGNVLIRTEVTDLVTGTQTAKCGLGAVAHPIRRSYREEAAAVLNAKLDDPAIVAAQLARYDGLPGLDETDLLETNLLVFDARDLACHEFVRVWWDEIRTYSRRDQLSVGYALLKAKLRWHALLPDHRSTRDSSKFALFRHGLRTWGPQPLVYAEWYQPAVFAASLPPL